MTFPYLLPPPKRRTWTCPSPPELHPASRLKDFGPHGFEYSQKKTVPLVFSRLYIEREYLIRELP